MIVVYCATKNYISKAIPSIRSLLINNPEVTDVYLITDKPSREDGKIKNIVTDGLQYFPQSGPNRNSRWTYMSLIRLALHRILPDIDRVLYLDCDTIVIDNISALDNLDLHGKLIAGVREPAKSKNGHYINAGVLLMDLKRLRETGKGDELIEDINTHKYDFPDQDCINHVLRADIAELPVSYNMSDWTGWSAEPHIMHYAAYHDYQDGCCPCYEFYEPYSTGPSIYDL